MSISTNGTMHSSATAARAYTLVTGGSLNLGKAFALECARRGRNVLIVALPDQHLEEAAQEIRGQYAVDVKTLAIDLAQLDAPHRVYEWCQANRCEIDFLINNAAAGGTALFEDTSPEYSDVRIMVNIRALALLTRLFLPALRRHSSAYILNVASLGGYYAIPYKAIYSASKSFVIQFTKALQVELSDSPIAVHLVCPGVISSSHREVQARAKVHGALARYMTAPLEEIARTAIDHTTRRGKGIYIPHFIDKTFLWVRKIIPYTLERALLKMEFGKEIRTLSQNGRFNGSPQKV